MAKKNKKKSSTVEQQKQLKKMRQSQSRNLFEEKLRNICMLIGDKSLYDLIPGSELELMYVWRVMPLKVVMAGGAIASQDIAGKVESRLKHFLDTETIELIPDSGIKISLSDYYLVATSIDIMLKSQDCEFPCKDRFDHFMENSDDRFKEYYNRVLARAKEFCSSFDDISANNLFACSFDVGATDDDGNPISTMTYNPRMRNSVYRMKPKVTITVLHPEEKQVEVDGKTLPAKQVGVVDYENENNPKIRALYVTPKQLKIKHSNQDLMIWMYITPHAIDRLLSCTECTKVNYDSAVLYLHISSGNFIPLSPKTFLMEYRLVDYKIGYFMAELTDGILLLSTFRLLTHPDTPEGATITKLAKRDAAYNELLNFNTLRPLLESTTLDNYGDNTATLLINAGCKPIVDFCRWLRKEGNLGAVTHNREPKSVQLPDFSLKTVLKNQSRLNNNEEFLM